jgi:hypothetical protein
VQTELLSKYPKADLRVYAIWFNMYPGDARSKWPPSLLADSRVIHRWDEGKLVGAWYGRHTNEMRGQLAAGSSWKGDILWDAYLFYGADAKWDEAPRPLIHWGRTIVAARETLRQDFERLIGAPRPAEPPNS